MVQTEPLAQLALLDQLAQMEQQVPLVQQEQMLSGLSLVLTTVAHRMQLAI
jgi:hypothetical protein